MDFKTFDLTLVEAKAGDNGPEFTGILSTFGNVDEGGDVVIAGAFDRTLRERDFRPLLWAHDARLPPIGIEKSLVVDEKGLLGTWSLLDTALGSDVYKALKSGALRKMSMGYLPTVTEYDDQGVRKLIEVDLLESSVVNLAMNEQAEVTNVKATWDAAYINSLDDVCFAVILPGGEKDADGRTTPRSLRKLPHHTNADGHPLDMAHLNNALSREPQTMMSDAAHAKAKAHLAKHKGTKDIGDLLDTDVPFEELFGQLKGWLILGADEAEALSQRRADDERKLSDAHTAAIRDLLDTAKAQSERLESLIAGPAEIKAEPAMNLRLELARRRLRSRGILEQSA